MPPPLKDAATHQETPSRRTSTKAREALEAQKTYATSSSTRLESMPTNPGASGTLEHVQGAASKSAMPVNDYRDQVKQGAEEAASRRQTSSARSPVYRIRSPPALENPRPYPDDHENRATAKQKREDRTDTDKNDQPARKKRKMPTTEAERQNFRYALRESEESLMTHRRRPQERTESNQTGMRASDDPSTHNPSGRDPYPPGRDPYPPARDPYSSRRDLYQPARGPSIQDPSANGPTASDYYSDNDSSSASPIYSRMQGGYDYDHGEHGPHQGHRWYPQANQWHDYEARSPSTNARLAPSAPQTTGLTFTGCEVNLRIRESQISRMMSQFLDRAPGVEERQHIFNDCDFYLEFISDGSGSPPRRQDRASRNERR